MGNENTARRQNEKNNRQSEAVDKGIKFRNKKPWGQTRVLVRTNFLLINNNWEQKQNFPNKA
jgi:hypothetical protein